jgi:purine-nucleoside phosphorylase
MNDSKARTVEQAVEFLRSKSSRVPDAAVILGSGVNVLENLPGEIQLSYNDVFGISPSVAGHSGSLSLGEVDGKLVAVLRGRFHLYEGHFWDVVTLPTRVLVEWGVPKLFVTNAAGGLNQAFQVGDLMLITSYRDHLQPKWREVGLLPALTKEASVCENELTAKLSQASDKLLATTGGAFRAIKKGLYAGLLGPTYETLAEIDMLKLLKADAVGMSTVPELMTADGTKTQACALSVITNVWTPDVELEGHEEVLRAAKEASQRLDQLLRTAITA